MTYTEYPAKTLVCRNCGVEFEFEPGEQAFWKKQGWPDPVRCQDCRREVKQKRRQEEAQNGG